MENSESAELMVKGAGELIENVYNLKGNLVGARKAVDTTANDVHFGDTNKDGQYVSVRDQLSRMRVCNFPRLEGLIENENERLSSLYEN